VSYSIRVRRVKRKEISSALQSGMKSKRAGLGREFVMDIEAALIAALARGA